MQAMHRHGSAYIPALSHDWLTPLYDTLIRLTLPEATFKRRLITEARIESNQRVLDLGCGTATLTLLIKSLHPDVIVLGSDGDEKILQIGRRKIEKAIKKIRDAGIKENTAVPLAFSGPGLTLWALGGCDAFESRPGKTDRRNCRSGR